MEFLSKEKLDHQDKLETELYIHHPCCEYETVSEFEQFPAYKMEAYKWHKTFLNLSEKYLC